MGGEEENNFKLRPMKCELNYLSKSDGSAILAQGTVIQCFKILLFKIMILIDLNDVLKLIINIYGV